MKILRQFTWASLKANRTRTLVTIIGIVLSMALFTAVLEGAYSGQQFLIRSIEESEGRWLVMESGLTAEEAAQLQGTDGVEDSSVWTEVGYGKIDSKNTSKPYLRVVSVDANVENLLAIHLLSGRMPTNENEVLLPANLLSDGGVQMKTGDTLEIALGRRVAVQSDFLASELSGLDAETLAGILAEAKDKLPPELADLDAEKLASLLAEVKNILPQELADLDSEHLASLLAEAKDNLPPELADLDAETLAGLLAATKEKLPSKLSELDTETLQNLLGEAGDSLPPELAGIDAKTLKGLLAEAGSLFSSPLDSYDPDIPEEIIGAEDHTYTVVGIYQRLPYEVEGSSSPAYTALTFGGGTGERTVFLTLKNPANLLAWDEAHPNVGARTDHDDLRRFYGVFTSDNYNVYLYGFAAVLLILIVFGSISLIYNSFSISVSARTKQFGILKSIGATNRQIRGSVLFEALLLAAIAIPIGLVVGCVGIGLTLFFLKDAFAVGLFMEGKTQMELVLNPGILTAAAGICLVTTVISAAIPAGRAMRVSPILSIRETQDVKMRRQRTGGKLVQKLFGFPGLLALRNFQRSRSKYRSTVASLILSLVLFISASSFTSYLTTSISAFANTGSKETVVDISYRTTGYQRPEPEKVLALLTGSGTMQTEVQEIEIMSENTDTENRYRDNHEDTKNPAPATANGQLVSKAAYYDHEGQEFPIPSSWLTKEAYENVGGLLDGSYWGEVIFLQDTAYRRLCEANGLSADEYFDAQNPRALLWNQNFLRMITEKGVKSGYYQFLKEDELPTLTAKTIKVIEGYREMGSESFGEGEEQYLYYPTDDNGEALWDQEPLRVPKAEAETELRFEVGSFLKEPAFGLPTDNFALVYPYSLKTAVFGSDNVFYQTDFVLQTPDHAKAFTAIKTSLTDAGMDTSSLYDEASEKESARLLVMAINVFAYGFIILISLIAAANVFNTISTNVLLRRREFAMLRSIGLDKRGFRQMMNYECLIYGLKALLWGLPAAIAVTFVMWRLVLRITWGDFYIPWECLAIAILSVFAVVFATMLYASAKVRRLNVIDALKDENA